MIILLRIVNFTKKPFDLSKLNESKNDMVF